MYSWSLAEGSLPGGLLLDAASGAIHGTVTTAGRFDLIVRAVDAADTTKLGEKALVISVLAALPPSVYDAIVDRAPREKGPLPALGGAGFVFTDPVFGTRMMRVTDGTIRPAAPNGSYRTPSGTHSNAWSADGRLFYVASTDGTIVPYAFDPSTMRASRLPALNGDGGLTLQFFNEPTFSYVTPGLAYATYNGPGSNLHSVDQYDFQSGQYSRLLDLESLADGLAGTYTGGLGASAGDVERLFAFFGGTSQDRHFYLVIFDKANPSNRLLLDTVASTVNGQPTNITLNFRIHAAAIDRSGRYHDRLSHRPGSSGAPAGRARVRVGHTREHVYRHPAGGGDLGRTRRVWIRLSREPGFPYHFLGRGAVAAAFARDAAHHRFRSSRRSCAPRRNSSRITRRGTTRSRIAWCRSSTRPTGMAPER